MATDWQPEAGSALAASKRAGENAEHVVFVEVDDLEPVSGEQHHDAIAKSAVFPSTSLPFVGVCVLETGSIVEIKSTMVVQTSAQRRGRFKLRKNQHEALLKAGGFYLFTVCEPVPDRPSIAMKVVPATTVDALLGEDSVAEWRDELDGRGPKAQLTWTNIFDIDEVEGGKAW